MSAMSLPLPTAELSALIGVPAANRPVSLLNDCVAVTARKIVLAAEKEIADCADSTACPETLISSGTPCGLSCWAMHVIQ